jgi:single-strand DNA-binding protein
VRQLPKSRQSVATFSVATDESFTGKDGNRQKRVQRHHIVVYGKLAESCGE